MASAISQSSWCECPSEIAGENGAFDPWKVGFTWEAFWVLDGRHHMYIPSHYHLSELELLTTSGQLLSSRRRPHFRFRPRIQSFLWLHRILRGGREERVTWLIRRRRAANWSIIIITYYWVVQKVTLTPIIFTLHWNPTAFLWGVWLNFSLEDILFLNICQEEEGLMMVSITLP